MKDSFVVLDLKNKDFMSAVKVLSNDTSRRILEFLSEGEFSETEISQKLGLPIATVHYHVEKLKVVGLVDYDNHRFSEKGKEVKYYKYTEKALVIAPKRSEQLVDILKKVSFFVFLPIFVFLAYFWASQTFLGAGAIDNSLMMSTYAPDSMPAESLPEEGLGISAKSIVVDESSKGIGDIVSDSVCYENLSGLNLSENESELYNLSTKCQTLETEIK